LEGSNRGLRYYSNIFLNGLRKTKCLSISIADGPRFESSASQIQIQSLATTPTASVNVYVCMQACARASVRVEERLLVPSDGLEPVNLVTTDIIFKHINHEAISVGAKRQACLTRTPEVRIRFLPISDFAFRCFAVYVQRRLIFYCHCMFQRNRGVIRCTGCCDEGLYRSL
jgi:hypothetical protein